MEVGWKKADLGFNLIRVVPQGSQAVVELPFGGGTLQVDGKPVSPESVNDQLRIPPAQPGKHEIHPAFKNEEGFAAASFAHRATEGQEDAKGAKFLEWRQLSRGVCLPLCFDWASIFFHGGKEKTEITEKIWNHGILTPCPPFYPSLRVAEAGSRASVRSCRWRCAN